MSERRIERYRNVYRRGYEAALEDVTRDLYAFLAGGGDIAADTNAWNTNRLLLRDKHRMAVVTTYVLAPAAFDFLKRTAAKVASHE